MKTRAITGFFFVVIMLGSFFAGPIVYSVFFCLLSLLCLQEFYRLVRGAGIAVNQQTGLVNGAGIFAAVALSFYLNNALLSHKLVLLLAVTLSSIFIQELFKRSETPFTNIGFTFLGLIFTIVPFSFFHALGFVNGAFNSHFPMAFLIMLWANDTGAYLSGRWLGRTKLFERHSPKKTWEGFFGGVVIASLAGFIISLYFKELLWNQWISAAIIIGCVGTMGDLVESMFKRSLNIKDSGGILPGHGGLLDRFDGLLLAAPIVYTYLYFVLN
ncbi:phosphatidate cytidylyltransferase [Mucilaginibacter sp. RS28]|uniref:Phosphatidate cytidylyltransferase n=1 Tax=Mucilaginibacter straminoryzae TaxID=2932774 RepID=A0A9X1X602_9SPHI|nr:phosphatidate cytidylyltransferase [Mucilaginibacter straminoryzae]MCJ8211762.1 phosphatidate cytidylyltransferase [Mucilaginibacter straminoryzae]